MPKGSYHYPVDKADVLAKMKELDERYKERMKALKEHIEQLRRREKYVVDLKKWLANRKLELADLMWMTKQLKPKRADKPVKSKKPLQPEKTRTVGYMMVNGKLVAPKGDPEFRRRILEARKAKGWNSHEVAKRIGVSHASVTSWEAGRYIPKEEVRLKVLKLFDLPAGLGAAATKAMEGSYGGKKDGAAAAPS
jgi:ribosome-binding protein aMBF1 (putative translation factor)